MNNCQAPHVLKRGLSNPSELAQGMSSPTVSPLCFQEVGLGRRIPQGWAASVSYGRYGFSFLPNQARERGTKKITCYDGRRPLPGGEVGNLRCRRQICTSLAHLGRVGSSREKWTEGRDVAWGSLQACHWLRVSRHHRKELNCAIFGTHPGKHPTTPRGPITGTMRQVGTGKGRLEEAVEEPDTQGTAEPRAP